MTLSFDRNSIDETPEAGFNQMLLGLIERGYRLDDFTVESEKAVAQGTSNKS